MTKEQLDRFLGESVIATCLSGQKMEGTLRENDSKMYPENPYIIECQSDYYNGYTYYFNPEIIVAIERIIKPENYSENN